MAANETLSNRGYDDLNLRTIDVDGAIPECRMANAYHCQDYVRKLAFNDQKRSKKRALVAGLIGGNPPFRMSLMRDANKAKDCNANWGTAFSYADSGSGAFYDLFSEAPGLINIRTAHGREEKDIQFYSRRMSANADTVVLDDPLFDYHIQQSQWEMTLFGCGPLYFEDAFKVLPRSAHCGDLKVPERTPADVDYFEAASLDVDYYPPQLYEFIQDTAAAKIAGWRVQYTRKAIALATEIRQPDNRLYDWEFYQQEVKNNSLTYYDDSKIIKCAVVWWKEFDGKITQAIIERDDHPTGDVDYLFLHIGRYENWRQALHPMYFDRGNGGFHHSVTGLGQRCYNPMYYENMLLCNLYDKAFAPDILFKPTTTEATQKFALTHLGQYGVVPAGWDVAQTPVKGFVQDGLAMFRTSTDLMRSNLANYRQKPPETRPGNPPTRYQKQLEAAQASAMSKTSYNRYYRQLDHLYAEIVRRLCNLNSPDPRAKRFQELCEKDGVPTECLGRIASVRAVRVIGEGSPFLRKESVAALMPVVGSLPEEGRQNWLNDFVSAQCGSHSVERYNPQKEPRNMADEQDERIANQIADMKVGVPPVINSSQNALRFAAGFLAACVAAIQSIRQGANMAEVVKFLDLAGPACMAHLKRIINDPLRQAGVEEIMNQLQQVMKITDQLKKQLQQQAQQRQQQRQKTQQAMSDQEIKMLKTKGDLAIKQQKAKGQMQLQAAKTRQQMALADAATASEIYRKNAQPQKQMAVSKQ